MFQTSPPSQHTRPTAEALIQTAFPVSNGVFQPASQLISPYVTHDSITQITVSNCTRLKRILQRITIIDETKPKFDEQKTTVAIRAKVKGVA
jgi:hypothetical protein